MLLVVKVEVMLLPCLRDLCVEEVKPCLRVVLEMVWVHVNWWKLVVVVVAVSLLQKLVALVVVRVVAVAVRPMRAH